MMSTIVGQDWRPKTHRELQLQWQFALLESWNHTASIKGCFADKKTTFPSLHPYLKNSTSSSHQIVITSNKLFVTETHRNGERVSIIQEMLDHTAGQ